jgi:hypothetical protein
MAKQQPVASNRSPSKSGRRQESGPGTNQKGRDGEVASHEKELARYLEQRIKPGLNGGAIPMLARSLAKQITHQEYLEGASEDTEADDEDDYEADDLEDTAEADDIEDSAEADDLEDSADADELEDAAEADDEDEYEGDDIEDSAEADDIEDSVDDSAEADDFEDGAEADDDEDGGAADDLEDSAEAQAPPDLEALQDLQEELGEDWIVRFCVQGDDTWLTAEKDDGSQYLEAPNGAVLAEVVGLLNEHGGRPG